MLGPYGEMLFLEAFPGRRGPPVQDEISGSQCVDVSIFTHSHHHHYNSCKTLRDIQLQKKKHEYLKIFFQKFLIFKLKNILFCINKIHFIHSLTT